MRVDWCVSSWFRIKTSLSLFAVPSPHLFPAWAGRWAGAQCGVACACVRLQRRTARRGPLGLYYFGNDNTEKDYVVDNTTSGGVTVNDVISHIQMEDLPFGGVGPSGMGSYHGYDGFKEFSHAKAVYKQTKFNLMKLAGLVPPYKKKEEKTNSEEEEPTLVPDL